MKKVILASTSPRRKKIMEMLGIPFEIIPSEYEEDMTKDLSPEELVKELAYGKAADVAKNHPDAVVIGGDSFVVLGKRKLGKPKSEAEAFEMLTALRGSHHQVYTGTSIIDTATGNHEEFVVSLDVKFREYTDETINWYIKTGEPMDKAGAYAIQMKGAILIDTVAGDYIGAIGLPIAELYLRLPKYGVDFT